MKSEEGKKLHRINKSKSVPKAQSEPGDDSQKASSYMVGSGRSRDSWMIKSLHHDDVMLYMHAVQTKQHRWRTEHFSLPPSAPERRVSIPIKP